MNFVQKRNYGHHKNCIIIREEKSFPWKRFKLYISLNRFLIEGLIICEEFLLKN